MYSLQLPKVFYSCWVHVILLSHIIVVSKSMSVPITDVSVEDGIKSHSIVRHCGFDMVDGRILHNCSGFYTTQVAGRSQIHNCRDNDTQAYESTVEVFVGDCSTVLLDYHKITQKKTVSIFPMVYISVSTLMMIVSAAGLLWVSMKRRVSSGSNEAFKLTMKGVTITDDISVRSFSWIQVLLIALCCKQVVTLRCVPPISVTDLNGTMHYNYHLLEGDMACFSEGTVEHRKSVSTLEVSELYHTRTWKDYVWSATKCGTSGDCGTVSECGHWGEHGRVQWRGDDMMYLKICRPHNRGFFVCPNLWGCWLATLEVSWDTRGPLVTVQEIGVAETDDDYIVHGLSMCVITQENDAPVDFKGLYLAHDNTQQSWLCEHASEVGDPREGHLGDLQFPLDGGKPTFDFSAFKCEFASPDSTGKCKVKDSSLKISLENCLRLPSQTDQGILAMENSELQVRGTVGRNFKVTCPSSVTLRDLQHDCFSISVEFHGVKATGHLTYLVIKADSHDIDSSMVYESSCGGSPLVVPCDGKERAFPITSEDYSTCYKTLPIISDKRVDQKPVSWHWDDGSVITGPFSHLGLSITTIIIISVAAIILYKCLFK